MIEDTSFSIDILHGDPAALARLDRTEKESRPEKVASVTVLELSEAVPQLDVPQERQQRIFDVLDTRHAVVADETVVRKAGKISGELALLKSSADDIF
ncbi:PIN domain-containing protein [Halomicrococcus gelatinilyticus]|uniref:hypothetical protein n=1 Tax=Halomicrococcus gelatinilyticus TaxID=1702103 RepID=UPI0038990642